MDKYKKLSYIFTVILVLALYGAFGSLIDLGVFQDTKQVY